MAKYLYIPTFNLCNPHCTMPDNMVGQATHIVATSATSQILFGIKTSAGVSRYTLHDGVSEISLSQPPPTGFGGVGGRMTGVATTNGSDFGIPLDWKLGYNNSSKILNTAGGILFSLPTFFSYKWGRPYCNVEEGFAMVPYHLQDSGGLNILGYAYNGGGGWVDGGSVTNPGILIGSSACDGHNFFCGHRYPNSGQIAESFEIPWIITPSGGVFSGPFVGRFIDICSSGPTEAWVGGFVLNTITFETTLVVYHLTGGIWTNVTADLPTLRNSYQPSHQSTITSCRFIDGKAYISGWYSAVFCDDSYDTAGFVYIYDPATSSWSVIDPDPDAGEETPISLGNWGSHLFLSGSVCGKWWGKRDNTFLSLEAS